MRFLLWVILGAALAWSVVLVGVRVSYIAHPDVYHSDAPFYFTVGRGILNGLTPYEDLFESKPPALFLLSALSLGLTDMPVLGNIFSVCILLCFPLLFAFLLRNQGRAGMMIGFSTGALLGLWNTIQAGVWQAESFGNFFALLYVVLLVTQKEELTWKKVLLAAACLAGAIGFKEPFLLSMAAVALVLSPRPKILVRQFLLPLGIALLAGALIMLILGWLWPYLTLYLPAIAGTRITGYAPLWLRGLMFWQVWQPLSYTSVLLPCGMVFLLGCALSQEVRNPWRIIMLLCAAYLSLIAVQLGGAVTTITYSAQLVPLVTALAALLLYQPHTQRMLLVWGAGVVLILGTMPWSHVRPVSTPEHQEELRMLRSAALRVNGMLRTCKADTYLFAVNPAQPLLPAYTALSPLNYYPYRELDNIQFGIPFLKKNVERLSQARILIVNPEGFKPKTDLGPLLAAYIQQNFSATPWPCAAEWLPIDGYGVLFRTKDAPMRVIETVNANGEKGLNFEY